MGHPLADATLRALHRIMRAADQGVRRLASATGLSPSQILVLQEVERRGETTPGQIAAALQFGQATMTNIVDRLEQRGLLTRRRGEVDRRQMILAVTQAGSSLLADAPDSLQERFCAGFDRLPDWEQAMMLAGLERLGEILGASELDAAPIIDTGATDLTR